MITGKDIIEQRVGRIVDDFPFVTSFFQDNGVAYQGRDHLKLRAVLEDIDTELAEDRAMDVEGLPGQLASYINQMIAFLGEDEKVHSLTVLPGTDKSGNRECFDELVIHKSEIISIVGPTGSGKSRLLGDIEWVAQEDTPTSRKIMINHEVPDNKWRFSTSRKLVAQLSQNMNFVMDLTVQEFVALHAESRMIENIDDTVMRIIDAANELAGEKFLSTTPITSLSGGQSRALMIADTAILSRSPVILIDEIENAGIDRKKALGLLLSEEKIVLMATHDPILALMGDRRIVIKNGGRAKRRETTDEEKAILSELEKLDRTLRAYRTALRQGESLISIKGEQ